MISTRQAAAEIAVQLRELMGALGLRINEKKSTMEPPRTSAGGGGGAVRARLEGMHLAEVAAQAKADAAAVVAARKSTTSANSSASSKTQFPTPKATSK